MKSMFLYTLRRNVGQMVGWGIALALMSILVITTYDIVLQNEKQLREMLGRMPAPIKALVGNVDRFITPAGYIDARFFQVMPLIGGIFAAVAGSGLLRADEEAGRLDLVMSYPLSRRSVFVGRVLALLTVMGAIIVGIWLGMGIGATCSSGEFPVSQLWLPLLCVFAYMTACFATALMLSLMLPSRRLAGLVSAIFFVASFLLLTIAKINLGLAAWIRWLPLNWYQGGRALDSFEWMQLAKLVVASIVQFGVAYVAFERRDIRVAGEGSVNWKRILSAFSWRRRSES